MKTTTMHTRFTDEELAIADAIASLYPDTKTRNAVLRRATIIGLWVLAAPAPEVCGLDEVRYNENLSALLAGAVSRLGGGTPKPLHAIIAPPPAEEREKGMASIDMNELRDMTGFEEI